jgi:hypothetical protein
MSKILYLLGAGASAQALPLVSNFNTRLKIFYDFLQKARQKGLKNESNLDDALLKLITEAESHFSIDTLAKKYKIAGANGEYEKVKSLMTIFFMFESFKKSDELKSGQQSFLHELRRDYAMNPKYESAFEDIFKVIDLRYDALLASMLNPSNPVLPSSVKFLSWNYDDQLEYAGNNILVTGSNLEAHSKPRLVNVMSSPNSHSDSAFNLIKLNGGYKPTFVAEREDLITFSSNRLINSKNIALFDETYNMLIDKPQLLNINFAWETESPTEDSRVIQAKKFVEEATDLVIIGYSFPNYNVAIDQYLFEHKAFKNIYIEDTSDNYDAIVERLEYLNMNSASIKDKSRIKLHKDLKTFCLPPSFYVVPPEPFKRIIVSRRRSDNSY